MKTTIASIAAHAGVSRTTVSHALSGKRTVAEDTRARVLLAVEELGYRPDRVAQSLRRQSTMTVALLVADLSNPYYPALAKGVHERLDADGYAILIGETDGTDRGERRLLEEMVARRADAVVIQPMALDGAQLRSIAGSSPLVVLGPEAPGAPVDLVTTDDAHGIRQAVEHLRGAGHERIGFITGPAGVAPSPSRLAAFRRAAADVGVTVEDDWVLSTEFTHAGGVAAARRLLDGDRRPSAVMCANDLIAIGVLDGARERGLAVPGDLAVVGFDDIDTARLLTPQLTTVRNPAHEVGRACADAVLRRLAAPDDPYGTTVLETTLQVRGTA